MENQKGVALIITFLVMTILLAMVLSISTILFNQVQIIAGIGNSTTSLYAADSGIEETLYLDRKDIPTGATRGLCNICNACPTLSADPCSSGCVASGSDCALASCTSCTVTYSTNFLPGGNKVYNVSASISAGNLTISSNGVYNGVTRNVSFTSSGL